MTEEQLPHNDPDLKLAQTIGRARANGTPLSELDDLLVQPLLEHREREHQRINSTDKQQVWQKITETTVSQNKKAPIYRLITPKNFRWAAAAVVLIAALFSFLYLEFWQQPELLAQSGDSIKTVQLADGSTVTLRPHSRLFEVKQTASILLYKLKGEALFEVTPKPHRTFSVKAKNGRVSVLGTRFILSSWGNRMRVFLDEGLVSVQPAQEDSAIMLHPGEAVSITGSGNINRIPNANAREFTDWLNRQLIFNSKPAKQIARELEQQFNISISLPGGIANNRLSGQLSLESLQASLNDLGLVLGGSFVSTGERGYSFQSN